MTSIEIRHFSLEPEPDSDRPLVVYECEDWIRQFEDDGAFIVRLGADGGRCHANQGHKGEHLIPVEPIDVKTLAAALEVVNA